MTLVSRPAERFARALAARLHAAVPRPVQVRAEGGAVAVYVDGVWWGSTLTREIIEAPDVDANGEHWPLAERLVTAARAVLNSVQDTVAESSRKPWPRLPAGGMALPEAHVQAAEVRLRYGADETTAVVTLRPLVVDEFTDERDAPSGKSMAPHPLTSLR